MSLFPMNRGLLALVALATLACQGEQPTAPWSDDTAPNYGVTPTGVFVDNSPPTPFGRFGGLDYIRVTGRFVGTTAQGNFRVPYQIVAPADPARGSGTVLVEPPHFALGGAGLEDFLGPELVFGLGMSYASVGWATGSLNILDPTATDVLIGGATTGSDDEIVVQFIRSLTVESPVADLLGNVTRTYGYGYSQTSFLMHRILRSPAGPGLLDLTVLNATWWNGGGFPGPYSPVAGVGRVVVVQSEGDIVIADAEVFRMAASEPDYRVYEVPGSSHIPWIPTLEDEDLAPLIIGSNPIDWSTVARAAFVAGDAWVRGGVEPPANAFMASSAGIDPVYGFPTGIARDADGNALGGVRLPDLAVGTGQYVAADLTAPIGPVLGSFVDLTCTALADGSVRFPTHGGYVEAVASVVDGLRAAGYLLQGDAVRMKTEAAAAATGKPEGC
jgi:hypothetical protein